MLDRLIHIDRRIIYIIVGIAVIIPLMFPFELPIVVSEPVQLVYDFIEKLHPGDTIIMGFDYGPSSAPELDPMAVSMLHQCFRKDIRIVALTLWAEGKPFMDRDLILLGNEYHKTYGKDYVNLGFQAGNFAVIQSIGAGFANAFPKDYHGTPLSDLPLMQMVHGFPDIAAVMDISVGDPGIKDWVKIVTAEHKRPVGGGVTAVWFPERSPFLQSHQLVGLIGGLRGAAEYEKLVGNKGGKAGAGMAAQSVVHVLMVFFIVLANVLYFLDSEAGTPMTGLELFWTWVAGLLTLCIFSFLYKDNPFYKLAEHIYVGVSAGYWISQNYNEVLRRILFDNLWIAGYELSTHGAMVWAKWLYVVPLMMGIMLLLRLFPGSRLDISLAHGLYGRDGAGYWIVVTMDAAILEQIRATIMNLWPLTAAGTFDWVAALKGWLVLLGVVSGLVYFYFSKEHKGPVFGTISKIGIWFLMITFGSAFGYTVMARVSLLIGRMNFLIYDFLVGTWRYFHGL